MRTSFLIIGTCVDCEGEANVDEDDDEDVDGDDLEDADEDGDEDDNKAAGTIP